MKELILKTDVENASFYVSSLAIGILEGMRSGSVPLECGTWSLARPIFWQALEECAVIDCRLVDWVSSLDELDALQKLDGSANKVIDEMLVLLKISQKKSLKGNPSLAISSSVQPNS